MAKRTVLIPLDGSEFSRQILRVVGNVFEPTDVTLILFRAAYPPVVSSTNVPGETFAGNIRLTGSYETYSRTLDVSYEALEKEREHYRQMLLDELAPDAAKLRNVGYTVMVQVDYGDPAQCIIDAVKSSHVDLVAMATHGRSGLGRLVLGSVAERVLRNIEAPVLLMRPAPTVADKGAFADLLARSLGQGRALHVAVATDGSAPTQQAVDIAAYLAGLLQTRLTVLVVADEREGSAQAQKVMKNVFSALDSQAIRPEFVPLVGFANEVVLGFLEKNPKDLLVLGSFQDRGAGAAAIGATAQRLVQYAPTSVLIVKGHRREFRRILVCADVDDDAVVTAAALLAEGMGASLDLVHVISPSAANYLSTSPSGDLALDAILSQGTHLSAVLQGWMMRLGEQGISHTSVHVQRGNMPETALELATKGDYDLVCVGSRSSAGHFPGSAANSVVRYAECSVLVVRSH